MSIKYGRMRTYRYSGSVFAHAACEYDSEVTGARENHRNKCAKCWNYFHLDVYYRNLSNVRERNG